MANLEGEWLEQNKHRSYPFVDNILVFAAPHASEDVNSWFLDAYITYRADSASDSVDIFYQLVSINAHSDWSITLYNTITGATSSLAVTNNSVAGNYRIVNWSDDTAAIALTIVFDKNHALDSAASAVAFDSPYPTLNSRCSERQPSRVDELGVTAGTWIDLGEVGELVEGYNIKIEVDPTTNVTTTRDLAESELRPTDHRILITAKPGAGLGRVPIDCDAPITDVFTINKIGGNNGNFTLAGDACYRIGRSVDGSLNPLPNSISIRNNCQACCDCADFATLLENIRAVKNRGVATRDIWSDIRTTYEEILELWNARTVCIGNGCRAKLFGYSFTGWLVTVQVWVGNTENCIQPGSLIDVTFGGGNYSTTYVPGSGMIYNSESNYSQVDPTKLGTNHFQMIDNSAINGSHYKLLTFTVRVGGGGRHVGATVDIATAVTTCGDEAGEPLYTAVQLLGNTNKS